MNLLEKIADNKSLLQFVKYCTVGVLNTIVCLGVIFICKSLIGLNPYLSNALGYIAGVINSFLWNKKWVFNSDGRLAHEAIKFLVGFGICYALQFVVVWAISHGSFGRREFDLSVFTLSGYGVATLVGNVVYTVTNYLYNRLFTFRSK